MRSLRFILALALALAGCDAHPIAPDAASPDARHEHDAGRLEPSGAFVAAYNAEARDAAAAVLREGGGAADAFVTATLVEYVIAPGVTSLAGPLGALVYDAAERRVEYLDAGLAAGLDPSQRYDPASPNAGRAVLVPGALHGLHALWRRHGRLPWARLVEPAIQLADEGFAVDALYAATVAWRAEVLGRSEYGRETFLPGGAPIAAGARLRQPLLAAFLREVRDDGADAMYESTWADELVEVVRAAGGALGREDLARYEPRWLPPRATRYRGYDVHTTAGRAYGGVWLLLALEALEHDGRDPRSRSDVERLELWIRAARAVHEEYWLYDPRVLDDDAAIGARLEPAYTGQIWERIQRGLDASPTEGAGHHSYHVTVVDADGNAVTGTHTINSLPWAEGLFVRGVPLTSAGAIWELVAGPGERVVNALTMHAVVRDGRLEGIGGTFGSSLLEAELQVLLGLLDEERAPSEVAARERFGTFPFDFDHPERGVDLSSNWIDARVGADVVAALEARGLRLRRDELADLGFGVFLHRRPDGSLEGASLDASYLRGGVTHVPAR